MLKLVQHDAKRHVMTEYRSYLLKLLDERGYIHQVTDPEALDALAAKEVVSAYIGFDATAPSLHVGNLVSVMLLRRLQQAGHRPIVLMGGGTTKVGDPSGKDESRRLLTHDEIEANMPRPRDRQSAFFDAVKRRVLTALDRSLDRAVAARGEDVRASAGAALWW